MQLQPHRGPWRVHSAWPLRRQPLHALRGARSSSSAPASGQPAAPVRMLIDRARAGSAVPRTPSRSSTGEQAKRRRWSAAMNDSATSPPAHVVAAPAARRPRFRPARRPATARAISWRVRPRRSALRHADRSRRPHARARHRCRYRCHHPATVGRSCVEVIAMAAVVPCLGRVNAWPFALEPQHAHAVHAGRLQRPRGSRPAPCQDPRR